MHEIQEGERIEREPMTPLRVGRRRGRGRRPSRCSRSARRISVTRCRRIFVISRDVEAAAPYRIEVTPGDATVAKGADQMINATLSGFDAADAAILIRKGSASAFERVPMVKAENGAYEGMLFDLAEPLDYVDRSRRRALAACTS